MNNPGYKSLGVFDITGTETIVGDWVEDLEGIESALVNLRFIYGASSGSPGINAYLQTTPDDGDTVCDIANIVFGTSSEQKLLNFSAATPKTTQYAPLNKTLASDTAVDGILGTKLRLVVVAVGTYSGSTQVVAGVTVR
jgi:hypothetical protein